MKPALDKTGDKSIGAIGRRFGLFNGGIVPVDKPAGQDRAFPCPRVGVRILSTKFSTAFRVRGVPAVALPPAPLFRLFIHARQPALIGTALRICAFSWIWAL